MTDLKAIQARSLEMAEYFVAFCKEHDLLCYLCGGGAIGALRNKGFIPWDDDLDFFRFATWSCLGCFTFGLLSEKSS